MASSQYKKIKDYEDQLWGYSSPVAVEKMRLCYNNLYGVNVLQITFRNVTLQNIYGLSIAVTLLNANGDAIYKDVNFNYYAMQVASGKTFGASEDIVVESEAVDFIITVKGADLNNGRRFVGKVTLDKMPKPAPLSLLRNYEEAFIERFNQTYPKGKLICMPQQFDDYWVCSCGKFWPNDITVCPQCGVEKDVLLNILPQLKQEEKERKAEAARLAAEEKRRQEEEARAAEEARLEAERLAEEARLEEERKRAEEAERLAKEEAERIAAEEAEKQAKKAALIKKLKYSGIAAAAIALLAVVIFVVIPKFVQFDPGRLADETSEPAIVISGDDGKEQGENVENIGGEVSVSVKPDVIPDTPEPNPDWFTDPILILGDDIGPEHMAFMCQFFDVSEDELKSYETQKVTAAQGHMYLDYVIGKENVEASALSSMLIIPKDEGGISFKLYNISYYNETAFAAQICTLGIKHADVIVASPNYSSGSTAMIGVMMYNAQIQDNVGKVIGTAVARKSMNVRAAASVDSERYATIPAGTVVEVLEIGHNLWYKIVWPGSELGYAYTSNYLNDYYTYTEITDQ